MLSCFDFIRESTTLAMALRLLLAFICGAVIGAEREIKRRPAGFRTHILICLGAAITTLTSQYLLLGLGLYTDIGRLGAQVIAGIGLSPAAGRSRVLPLPPDCGPRPSSALPAAQASSSARSSRPQSYSSPRSC